MKRAKNVISIQGAGLTNCMFMKEGGNVLELKIINDNINNYYFSLCNAVGLNYYYKKCSFQSGKLSNSNLKVNPLLFENIIQKMLGLS